MTLKVMSVYVVHVLVMKVERSPTQHPARFSVQAMQRLCIQCFVLLFRLILSILCYVYQCIILNIVHLLYHVILCIMFSVFHDVCYAVFTFDT